MNAEHPPISDPQAFPGNTPTQGQVFPFQPSEPPRRRGPLFWALCFGGGVAVIGSLVLGTLLAIPIVSHLFAEASASFAGPTGDTVLSESWYVDEVEVAYIEEGGTPCENEYCWEWLLLTQPDCATAAVTVEVSEDLFGEAQRVVEQSIATERVTSVLVESEADDGEYAEITSIACG